jgi:two-component system, cell cycle response regulator
VPGKILIVDDISTNRIVLKVKLAAAYYETCQAATGADALRLAREITPDLILLDIRLPDMDGIAICAALKRDPATRAIPVVMVSATRDGDARIRALRAGAEDVFWKPFEDVVLLARLRSILRAREAEQELGMRHMTYRELGFAEPAAAFEHPATVVLISSDAAAAGRWKRDLDAGLNGRTLVLCPDQALVELDEHLMPDAVVLAADLDRPGDGLRLMSELRSRRATRFTSVCVVVPKGALDLAAMALDLGANDIIETGTAPEEMVLRVQTQIARKRQHDRLRTSVEDGLKMAMTDPLTGLHNRRYALPHLARIARRARESGRNFAIMVLDLDRFKSVNDTWGHAAGDAVLVEVANRFRGNLRAVDLVARIGGEEFLVALPDISLEAAKLTAERLRRVIEETPVAMSGDQPISVTMSIGLAMGGGADFTEAQVDGLVDCADRALMGAKSDGRNQVTVFRSAA